MFKKFALTLSALALFAIPAFANGDVTAPSTSIVQLPSYLNTDSFDVSYTAYDAGSGLNNVTLAFHKEGDGWSTLANFTTTSGKFSLTGSQITGDAKFYFQVTACDNSSNCASSDTSTTIDRQAPPAPESYQKEKISSQKYRLRWHTPNNSDVYRLYVYRSDQMGFTADSGSQVATFDVTPNFDQTLDNDVPDANKDYFYILRIVDRAGNASGLVGDEGATNYTTVYPSVTPGSSNPTGIPGQKLVALSANGSVLGSSSDKLTPTPTSSAPEALNPTVTPSNSETPAPSSRPWSLYGAITLVLFALGFTFLRRK